MLHRTWGAIPSRAVLRTRQVISFVSGDIPRVPGTPSQPGSSRIEAPVSSSCQMGTAGLQLAQGRCPVSREGVSAQASLPNRLANEPGIGREREEKGVLLSPHSSAQRWGIRLCREFGEHGIDKAPHVLRSSSAGPAPKGLRAQGGLMEAWWDAAYQPGSYSSLQKALTDFVLCPTALQGPPELPGHLCHESVARGEAEGDGGLG